MSANVDSLLERRLLVCVGPGGVGKTTTAAALALRAAEAGKRALVLTIDPARRLADALGLDGLDDAVRPVAGVEGGRLHAAMLDTKASFDALIARVASDDEERARILDNRVYRAFSRTLARSHAYVAMERLYDVTARGEYDLVVLDTPPTRSALDILDAPGQLVRFLDDGMVRWFVRSPGSPLPRAAHRLARSLGRLVGDSIVEDLLEFFAVLSTLADGFRERAHKTAALLEDESTRFVLVTGTEESTLADTEHLRDGLLLRRARIGAVIFNRAYVPEVGALDVPVAVRVTKPAALELVGNETLLQELEALRARLAARNVAGASRAERFARAFDRTALRIALPDLAEEVADVAGLRLLLETQRSL